MVFSSLVFLCIFLPAVFLSYTLVPSKRVKNGILIVTSLLFYAYGEPVYVFLMIGSTIVNYFFGLLVEKGKKGRRLKLGAAVFLNLLLLGVFKYAGMAAETVNQLTGAGIPVPQIVLPVGISFFTFQAMSYVIDVYRGQVDAQRSYWKVLLYISFFPQLIAGPIVKYYDIALEIENRQQNLTEVAEGFRRFCIGLSKKVLISNTVALAADAVFALPVSRVNILTAWIGAISYLLQIYYDFSGYSDMAIGLGKMFGFHFKENFHYPYAARSIQDFWRRWHMSLSTWFKEYLYIPLGGNRKGKIRTCVNKMVVFFCTGLWHGASWTFVVWGLYHGVFLMIESFLPKGKKAPAFLGHLYALLVVTVGFVLFRADTLSQGLAMIAAMFTGFSFGEEMMSTAILQLTPLFLFMTAAGVICAAPWKEWLEKKGRKLLPMVESFSYPVSIALLILCILSLSGGTYNPFIYFRF